MSAWFLVSVIGLTIAVPLHFRSVDHTQLQKKYGIVRGIQLGTLYRMISGWMEFIFLIGLWISPQPHFSIPFFSSSSLEVPLLDFPVPLLHVAIGTPLLLAGAWIVIAAVRLVGLRTAETMEAPRDHRQGPLLLGPTPKVSRRRPGTHRRLFPLLGLVLSAIHTHLPVLQYLISWKEEKELIREFGREYVEYRRSVPMFLPLPSL
jgi:hypothetical protein